MAGSRKYPHVEYNDAIWRKIIDRVTRLDGAHVKVGVISSKGGDAKTDDGITMVELAAIHEFGSPAASIPERSFVRRTLAAKRRAIQQNVNKLARAIVKNTMGEMRALELLGTWLAQEIKKTITAGPHLPPPLKPATIEAKGSDRPLVDTGRLVDSITHEVVP